VRGEGGERTVDLAFVDEGGLIHELLIVGDEVVKGPAHLKRAIVSLRRGGLGWRRRGAHQTTCK